MSKVKRIIKGIVKTINDDTYLKSVFYYSPFGDYKTKNRKYTVQYLLLGLRSKPCRVTPENMYYLY